VTKWVRRSPRASAALATLAAAVMVFGGMRAYRAAAERAAIDTLWSQYQVVSADAARLEQQHGQPGLTAAARAEIAERLEFRTADARAISAALLGMTRGRPDPRVVEAIMTRLRQDVNAAVAEGNYVRVKVLAETRLALIDQLDDQLSWPPADIAFLRAALEQANARIAADPR
jgi:hypothetical protein